MEDSFALRHGSRIYERFIVSAADWLNPKRIKIYTLSLPLAAVAVVLIEALLNDSLRLLYRGDFILYYTGGKFLLSNRLSELYDFATQEVFQVETLRVESPQLTPFNHPPFTVLFYAPFAAASFELGLILWSTAGLLALALAWGLLRRELSPLAVFSTFHLTLLSFCFYPTIAWILGNQNSPFTFLIYTITYVQLRRGRDLAAGAALGFLLYKPQLALAPALLLLIKARCRALIGFFLTASLLIAAGFVLSPKAMSDYVRVLPQIAELPFLPGYPISKMHNFYGFSVLLLGHLLSPRAIELMTLLLTIGGLLIIVTWWRTVPWQPGTRIWDLNLASTFALGLLISPHLMVYDLMALLLPLAIVWSYYPKGTGNRALDNGPLLAWTALVYVVVFVSTYSTWGMLQITSSAGLPKFAVQLSILISLGWAIVVHRAAADEGPAAEGMRRRRVARYSDQTPSTFEEAEN